MRKMKLHTRNFSMKFLEVTVSLGRRGQMKKNLMMRMRKRVVVGEPRKICEVIYVEKISLLIN